jgi:multicomponent Na+:H+ antiporter subunit F
MTLPWVALTVVLPVMVLSVILALIRFVVGPTAADRVVALDVLAILVIGVIAVYAIGTNQPVFLDTAIVLALVSFLGTVAFAKYLERRKQEVRSPDARVD